MSMYELAQQVNETVNQYIFDSGAVRVCASEAGLNERCGEVYISVEHGWIATEQIGSLEYYGGFEYVGSGHKERIGEYMFYSNESSRVQNHIEIFEENHQPEPTPEDEALGGIEYVLENVRPLEEGNKYTELFYLAQDRAIEIEIDSYGRVLVSDVINPADACGEYSPRISARIIAAGFIDDRVKILADVRNYIQTGCINPINPIV
jgi:hypothetical protein